MSTQQHPLRRVLQYGAWQRLSRSQRGTLLAYVAVIILFIIGGIYRPGFLRLDNIGQLLLLASFVGLVAAGQTFVILIGGIDLSVPWVLNTAAIVLVAQANGSNGRLPVAIILALVLGLVCGLVNGLGIALLGVPAVVMTLGMN